MPPADANGIYAKQEGHAQRGLPVVNVLCAILIIGDSYLHRI